MNARGVALLAVAAALAAPLACFVARAPFGGYACDTAHGCVDGQTCFRGACVAACTTVADCADGLACVEGACTDAAPDALDAGTGDAGSVDAGDVDGGDVDGGDVDGGDADGGSPADAGPDAGTLCYGDPPECFPAAIVVTVCPGEPCPPGATAPTLDDSIGWSLPPIPPLVVFLPAGTHDATVLALARDITIVGEDGAIIDGNDGFAVAVRSGGHVTIHNVDLVVNGNDAALDLEGSGSSAEVERATISGSGDQCIDTASGTTLLLRRSIVTSCGKGAVDLDGDGTIEHCVIADSGSIGGGANGSNFGGVYLRGAPERTAFRFNTLVGNHANDAPAVRCASPSFVVDSSISWDNLGSSSGEDDMVGCTVLYSDVEDLAAPDTTTISADPQLVDGGFHIAATSPAKDAARPDAGVDDDFDGDVRPIGPGYDIGADEAP